MYKPLKFQVEKITGSIDDWDSFMKREQAEFERVNNFAKANDTHVGRTFRIQTADSYSHYQIIGQTKHKFRVAWLEIGDAWTDHYYGRGGSFPKEPIVKLIGWEDALARAFSKK